MHLPRPHVPRRLLGPITTPQQQPLRLHLNTKPTKPTPPAHPQPASALFAEIKTARPAVRYTLYAAFALMVAGESTFWYKVLSARFFPPPLEEDRLAADRLLADVGAAVQGYRAVWMANYAKYYGVYLWGLGYGGLDGLERGLEED